MDVNWKDYQGNDESFWEHEYNKVILVSKRLSQRRIQLD
jgi:hypothetical protein